MSQNKFWTVFHGFPLKMISFISSLRYSLAQLMQIVAGGVGGILDHWSTEGLMSKKKKKNTYQNIPNTKIIQYLYVFYMNLITMTNWSLSTTRSTTITLVWRIVCLFHCTDCFWFVQRHWLLRRFCLEMEINKSERRKSKRWIVGSNTNRSNLGFLKICSNICQSIYIQHMFSPFQKMPLEQNPAMNLHC